MPDAITPHVGAATRLSVSISQPALHRAVLALRGACEKQEIIPILGCALLEARGERLTITVTDLDLRVSVPVEADVAAEGAACIPFETLDNIRQAADRASIIVIADTGGGEFGIHFDAISMTCALYGAAEFPRDTTEDDAPLMVNGVMEALDLRRSLSHVRPAISTDETRYYLNGVHLVMHKGWARVQSTDGHRLHVDRFEALMPDWPSCGGIVPTKAVKWLIRNAIKSGLCTISSNGACISFSLPGGIELRSRLIDGTYPDTAAVFPGRSGVRISVRRTALQDLVEAILRLSVSRVCEVALSLENGQLRVAAPQDRAVGRVACKVAAPAGRSIGFSRIGLDTRYLRDGLLSLAGAQEVELIAEAKDSPITIRSTSDRERMAVVMPRRI